MRNVQKNLGIVIPSTHGLWTWALRHSAWLLNRFSPVRGATPFELRPYRGRPCEFAEPVFRYAKTVMKGNPRWQRMICIGKVEAQDTFVLYTGSQVVSSRSIRRIFGDWKTHMRFHVHFDAPTWNFKVGYGGRVVPTKFKTIPRSVGFKMPKDPIEPSGFYGADAEAVKEKAKEEQREEREVESRFSGTNGHQRHQRWPVFGGD